MRWKNVISGVLLVLLLHPVATVMAACLTETPGISPDLHWPVPGVVINGWTLDCATDRGHRGIDIAATEGEQILAAAAGTVAFTGYTPAEGGSLTVAISHDNGIRSTYLQLQAISVASGQQVTAGEPIGTSNGAPLHFGLKLTGTTDRYINPLDYLPGPGGSEQPADPVIVADTIMPAVETPPATVTAATAAPVTAEVPLARDNLQAMPALSPAAAVNQLQAEPLPGTLAPAGAILTMPAAGNGLAAAIGGKFIDNRNGAAPALSAGIESVTGPASNKSEPMNGCLIAAIGLALVVATAAAGGSFSGARDPHPAIVVG